MKKVVIIGAGPAGVTAGYELLKKSKDFNVTILEESNFIGGIARTAQYNGNRIDLGGHRFFSKDEEVTAWWNKIMPLQGAPAFDDILTGRKVSLNPDGPNPEKEDVVLLKRRRVSRIYYKKNFFDYPVKINLNTIFNMGLLTTAMVGLSFLKHLWKIFILTASAKSFILCFLKIIQKNFGGGILKKFQQTGELNALKGFLLLPFLRIFSANFCLNHLKTLKHP